MENILYIDDYINLYNKTHNKIYIIKPYKDSIHNSVLYNEEKFTKSFLKLIKDNKLNNNIFSENITIIHNSLYSDLIKNDLKNILNDLNYKNINYINELDLIKIDKDTLFINFNYTYFYIYYIDELNKTKIKIYNNDEIDRSNLYNIIKLLNKKQVILTGKNYQEAINILKKSNASYFYYENNENTFIELILKVLK